LLNEGAAMVNVRFGFSLFLVLGFFVGTSAADGTGRCPVPLQLRRGVPFVKVMLNGRGPFIFAVDTGTSRAAIVSPAVVKELKLPMVGRAHLLDLTGRSSQTVDETLLGTIELPGHAFRSVRAMVHASLPSLGPYDGVLGFSLFRDTILTLDFPQRCLRLGDAGLPAGSDPNVLPFSTPRNVPVVALTIGEQRVLAQIDSGGGGINLPGSAASAVEFAAHTEVPVRAQSQLNNFFLRGGVMKGEVVLGGHVFRQPFVEIGDQIPVGNLGALSLQDFAITFDQGQRLVRFQAPGNVHRLNQTQFDVGNREPAKGAKTAGFEGGS